MYDWIHSSSAPSSAHPPGTSMMPPSHRRAISTTTYTPSCVGRRSGLARSGCLFLVELDHAAFPRLTSSRVGASMTLHSLCIPCSSLLFSFSFSFPYSYPFALMVHCHRIYRAFSLFNLFNSRLPFTRFLGVHALQPSASNARWLSRVWGNALLPRTTDYIDTSCMGALFRHSAPNDFTLWPPVC